MARVCAWCHKEINDDRSFPEMGGQNSKQICEECKHRYFPADSIEFQTFLDSLDYPVVVSNEDHIVQNANASARELLGKTAEEIHRQRGGVVFQCEHADKPGGCGKTIHCSGCSIRIQVTHTATSGETLVRRPAYMRQQRGQSVVDLNMLITTQKLGDVVLVQIDEITPGVRANLSEAGGAG